MFNVSTNEWQFIGSLNVSRAFGSMVCLKGTLYVLGGMDNEYGSQLSVECFDPAKKQVDREDNYTGENDLQRQKLFIHWLCSETLQRSTRQT